MTGIRAAAERTYRENAWGAEPIEDGSGFTFVIEGSDTTWSAFAITDDEEKRFAFYSLAPLDATPGALSRVAEYLHRANLGLVEATFELDYDSGEIRLRTGLELATLPDRFLDDEDALAAMILDLSAANVGVMDSYVTGLVACVAGTVPVAQIIAEIEGE